MTKESKRNLLIVIAAVFFVLFFTAAVLLSLPLGASGGVLPPLVSYVIGGVGAALSLAAAILFFIRMRKGG